MLQREERLDVELAAERIPQLLTAAVLDPREQLVCGEAEGHRPQKKLKRRRLLFEVALERVIHVGDAGPTASKVSNGRTNAPAGNTSILMRPPVVSPIACASRTALG